MSPEKLHVVTAVANPVRWQSRMRLYKDFEQHMLDTGVDLTVVECQYGERPHEIEELPGVRVVRVRSKTLVWNKENLINIGVSRLPEGWKYMAWVDADVEFRRAHWATETVHALQQYDVVQPWSDAYDLGPNDEHIQHHKSFCSMLWHDRPLCAAGPKFWKFNQGPYDYPHPGYAWAMHRQAFEWLGGLLEIGAVGAGDHHMALALTGNAHRSVPAGANRRYVEHLMRWQARAQHHINGNIGFVHGTLEHAFHGRKNDRRYVDRWDILVGNDFDPEVDLKKNSQGVLELAGNKPKLRHQLDHYFKQRNEDVNSLD